MTIQIQQGQGTEPGTGDVPWGAAQFQHRWEGFFETMRLEGGRIKRLEAHLARLFRCLAHWGFDLPCPEPRLREALALECASSGTGTARRVRLVVSELANQAAAPIGGLRPSRAWIESIPLEGENLKPLGQRAARRAEINRDHALNPDHPLAGFKSTRATWYREALAGSTSRGWDEGILLNARGEVTEACNFNVFWIAGERIFTPHPRTGCLPGVMAAVIQRVAANAAIMVEECSAPPVVLLDADAIFLTNSVAEIIPVSQLDDRTFSNPCGHPVLQRIIRATPD